ncbi:peptidylprolyl isomerase [Candidatus Bathyarchaeota archaeon]|nr:peptidylprolyl isomerase [Candidatus Bathyarchaeota archaeon]
MVIENGNLVKMHFDAKIDDRVIDTSRNRDPIEFKVGEGQVLQGLDEAVVGLKKGEKKTVMVPPEKAYGQRQEGLTQKIPRDRFRELPQRIEEGTVVRYRTEQGKVRLATIAKVEEDNVTLDLNHPLAGQAIKFELEIVDIK